MGGVTLQKHNGAVAAAVLALLLVMSCAAAAGQEGVNRAAKSETAASAKAEETRPVCDPGKLAISKTLGYSYTMKKFLATVEFGENYADKDKTPSDVQPVATEKDPTLCVGEKDKECVEITQLGCNYRIVNEKKNVEAAAANTGMGKFEIQCSYDARKVEAAKRLSAEIKLIVPAGTFACAGQPISEEVVFDLEDKGMLLEKLFRAGPKIDVKNLEVAPSASSDKSEKEGFYIKFDFTTTPAGMKHKYSEDGQGMTTQYWAAKVSGKFATNEADYFDAVKFEGAWVAESASWDDKGLFADHSFSLYARPETTSDGDDTDFNFGLRLAGVPRVAIRTGNRMNFQPYPYAQLSFESVNPVSRKGGDEPDAYGRVSGVLRWDIYLTDDSLLSFDGRLDRNFGADEAPRWTRLVDLKVLIAEDIKDSAGAAKRKWTPFIKYTVGKDGPKSEFVQKTMLGVLFGIADTGKTTPAKSEAEAK